MNIAYIGGFLKEGLIKNNHTVIDIPRNNYIDINDAIENLNIKIDIVILELYGKTDFPRLANSKYKLIGYAIDSSINEFWLFPLAHIFDLFFCDQLDSVMRFRSKGIEAHWLPLCAQDSYFRYSDEKEYDITFIGNTSKYRLKRNNLIKYLKKNTNITTFENISFDKMQDICAQSRIVLNENLFNGFTLRVLQGLASGSLVLTESDTIGVDHFFTHEKELVTYSHLDILDQIDKILSNYQKYEKIATEGQKKCREQHTSQKRTLFLLEKIAHDIKSSGYSQSEKEYYEAIARYMLAMRFGGQITDQLEVWSRIYNDPSQNPALHARCLCAIATFYARRGDFSSAKEFFSHAQNELNETYFHLRLALLELLQNHPGSAMHHIQHVISVTSPSVIASLHIDESDLHSCSEDNIFYLLAKLNSLTGALFHSGFFKIHKDEFPDTSFDYTMMAWNIRKDPKYLDFMLFCLHPYHLEGELIPYFIEGIQEGICTNLQILKTAELALSYYDFDLANSLINGIKRIKK